MKKKDKFVLYYYDVLAWIVGIDTWANLRKETKSIIYFIENYK